MRRLLLVGFVAVSTALAVAGSGRATFPGCNGLIVFTTGGELGTPDFVSINSRSGSSAKVAAPAEFGLYAVAAWSPDGRRLAFVRWEESDPPLLEPVVYVSSVGGVRRIGIGDRPAWSPDGRRLAFFLAGGPGAVFVFDFRSGRTQRVASSGGPPAWSPDGTRLVYGASRRLYSPSSVGLWVVRASGGPPQRLLARISVSERPAWSPDGTRIAFIDQGDDSLRQLDLRTRHVTTVARPLEIEGQSFSWSPRGDLLAYLRPAALRVVRADGSHDRALLQIDPTKLGDALVSFAWSPDAKSIATLDDSSVSVVRVKGGEHRLLFGGPHFRIGGIAWPTADNIRIATARDTQHLVVSQPDGSERRQLTTGSSWDSSPRWSPDGRQIAFAGTRTGDDELYVMNADGSGMRQLTHNRAEDVSPSWSPDGDRLAFASNRGGSWAIWTMSIDGTDARKFATGGRLGATAPVWSPDGRWIAYGRVDQLPPIVPTTVIARADTGAVICTSSFPPVSWSPDSRQLELGPNKPGEAATIDSNCTPGPVRFGDIGPFLWAPDGSGTLSCAVLALYIGCDADWQPLPPAKAR